MATNNNINYGPAAIPGTVTTPVLGNNIDRAPAPVPPGTGIGVNPVVTAPVVPVTEQPVLLPPTPTRTTTAVIPVVEQTVEVTANVAVEGNVAAPSQQRYITILENGNVIVTNASSLNFSGNVTVTASGTYGANIVLSGGGGNANAAGSNSQIQYNNNGSLAGSSGLTWDNGNGILSVTGNVFASSSGSFKGNTSTGVNALYAGTEGFTALGSNVIAQFTSNVNSYAQINFQNVNNSNRASTDYVLTANNGTDSTYYMDLGIAGNTHADPAFFGDTTTANDGYLYVVGNAQTGPAGGVGNLILGSSDGVIKMFVGNTAQANVIATINSNGISVNGNIISNLGNITNLDSFNFTVENISALVGNNGVNIGAGGFNNLVVLPTEVLIQNVPLTVAGNILSTVAGGLNITANTVANGTAQIWNFGTDGRLTFPGTPIIDTDSNNFEVQAAENISFEANAVVNIYTDTSGTTYQWQFGDDGNLTAPGNISATGNITGGNVLTGGVISATANITGGNVLTAGLISATSTITSAANITGGNVLTGGLISATSTITSAANVTGGNILTGGLISATANITGGNVTTAGLTSTASLSITGNTATVTTANYSIGYLNVPQVSLSSNSTVALTDSGKHYYSVSASNLSLTIANNTSVSWPVGTAISIVNGGTANILINQGTGVSMYLAGNATAGNRVLATFGMATIMNTAANVWFINGTGLT